jgi:hypothetical protein
MFLKPYLESKLKLAWIESLRRLSKTRTGCKRIDRHSEIGAIQNVETFREKLQVDSLGKFEPPTQTQVERGEVKPTPGVSSHAHRPIVSIRIEVTIISQQHVERQTRSVGEDVT